MKGVVLGICPGRDARRHHARHSAARRAGGALELAACYRYFPRGTIFLVVVDPGVGSARRGIAVEAGRLPVRGAGQRRADGRASRGRRRRRVVELTERRVRAADRQPHVRGARPLRAGGSLAREGLELVGAGPPVDRFTGSTCPQPRRERRRGIAGEVLRVDRFGNLITNIDRPDVRVDSPRRSIELTAGGARRSPAIVVDLCRRRAPASRARCSAAATTWRSPSTAASAARSLALGRGAAVHVEPPRVIRILPDLA